MNNSRLFQNIIQDLCKEKAFRTKEIWHSKSAWREMLNSDDFADLINVQKAVDVIKKQASLFCEKVERGRSGGEKFCSLRKIIEKRSKEEDRMERLLVASVDTMYNRFNFLSGLTATKFDGQTKHMTIDLVEAKDGKVNAFIELKARNNRENPLSALCEVVMYFLLFKNVQKKVDLPIERTKRFHLIVLAPEEYYLYFGEGQDSPLLEYISSSMSKRLGAICKFSKLKIPEGCLNRANKDLETISSAYQEAIR